MIKLKQKLDQFVSRAQMLTVSIPPSELASVNAKSERFLGPCIFEGSVAIASPAISKFHQVFLGAKSYMNDGGYLRDRVFIGRYCSVGRRVTIGAGAHSVRGLSTSPSIGNGTASPYTDEQSEFLGLRSNRPAETIIENDVWIGDGAVILSGVRISTGSVVGANSVVTSDVPAYSVVGGIPARVIRHRFPAELAAQLLSSEWWEMPHDALQSLPTGNVIQFLQAVSTFGLDQFTSDEPSFVLSA